MGGAVVVTEQPVEIITGHPATLRNLTRPTEIKLRERWPDQTVTELFGYPLVVDEQIPQGIVLFRPKKGSVPDPVGTAVHSASMDLAAALRVRITHHSRRLFPAAVTLRTGYNEYSHRNVVWRVCGPSGRVLFDRESGGDLYSVDPGYEDASQVMDDVATLVPLVPRDGIGYVKPLAAAGEWSIRLLPAPRKDLEL